METYVINFISGPGAGKSLMAFLLFAELKLHGYLVEYVPEYAKSLVWSERFDVLNEQYYVSRKQFESINRIYGKVQFVITDGPLIHGVYYNRSNPNNVSDVQKTETQILKWASSHKQMNIFLERGEYKYEQAGREQNE